MSLTLPLLSAFDPAANGEGSRDPLGLEALAERLASQYMPAVTSRMFRIRALTVLAVGAHVCDEQQDAYTADGQSPAWLVFEWMWATAMATTSDSALRIPGISTTRKLVKSGEPLNHRNYVKTAASLGLHGFYRTLAEATDVLDKGGRLGENGERLLRIWAREQGLEGFLGVTRGPGRQALQSLRDDLQHSLSRDRCVLARTGYGAQELKRSLRPSPPEGCAQEKQELQRLLRLDDRRAALLEALANDLPGETEFDRLSALSRRARNEEVAAALQAMSAFERFAHSVTTGFDLLRFASTRAMRRPAPLEDLVQPEHHELAARLPGEIQACDEARPALAEQDPRLDAAADAFRDVRTAEDLVEALHRRHLSAQRGKSGGGKLPWFDGASDLVVRSAYIEHTRPGIESYAIHPTRIANASHFLKELA